MNRHELSADGDTADATHTANREPHHHRIALIGAGLSGLALAIELRLAGRDDFVLLERADDVGGVWRDNHYPGVAVDVPSKLYNLGRAPNPDWSRRFAPGAELLGYARDLIDRHDLGGRIRFGHDVLSAHWDGTRHRWTVRTSAGTLTCDLLVSAAGLVADPRIPGIPGLDSFPGPVFHSARWDHTHDFRGERVAVVGTGASAIQFVPRVQPVAGRLHVFQRTPTWISPRPDAPITDAARRRLRRHPSLMRAERTALYWAYEALATARRVRPVRSAAVGLAKRHLARQVPDPVLREKLTPDFEIGCKRALLSSDFYPAMSQPNVTLHTGGLTEVRGHTLIAGDGSEADVDAIVLNTGFEIGRTSPIARRITGRGGRTLAESWNGSPRGYLGMAHPEFPNFFLMQGPNATTGASSVLIFADLQARYIADAIRVMDRRNIAVVEVRAEHEARYTRWVRRRSASTVWERGGCDSYYQDDAGRNVVLFPGFTFEYQWRARRFDPDAYTLTPPPARARTALRPATTTGGAR
ncbi:NAD(P)/FAD-dependent oxidoreductase [Streptomyces sp. J2-1]|uniref:flavin-containing monooxygenase n=1 Tax=Streptomyces corallincola TaxID=2851888 RepID=UPI001C381AEA|nr:NAD(P)/FAD-dependent oxidoreductase [Streptomyces corallincola]MBV2353679.1 NAD(P)/FAD-dependent oxidoreductase [Streptomyces corallincola]